MTPPFAPPNGTSATAVFQVMYIARARASSSVIDGWNRNPPFCGTAGDVVLHAKAGEDPEGTVVHLHREMHGQLALDLAQHGPQGVIKPEGVGGGVELPLSNAQGGALIEPGHAQAALYATGAGLGCS